MSYVWKRRKVLEDVLWMSAWRLLQHRVPASGLAESPLCVQIWPQDVRDMWQHREAPEAVLWMPKCALLQCRVPASSLAGAPCSVQTRRTF